MVDIEDNFYTSCAKLVLENRFGVKNPTDNQVNDMKLLLFNAWLKRTIIFDERLTKREKAYLLFASQGQTYRQIADTLGISEKTVRYYEKEILRKLSCSNMKQAVAVGLRYGDIAIVESPKFVNKR